MKMLINYLKYCLNYCSRPFLPLPTYTFLKEKEIKDYKIRHDVEKIELASEFLINQFVEAKLMVLKDFKEWFKTLSFGEKISYLKKMDSYEEFKYIEDFRSDAL